MDEKTLQDHFLDWESETFGFGYGTGEPHVFAALLGFMRCVGRERSGNSYDYREVEAEIGPVATWLLINALCHADMIEYGSSPRFAWLTAQGMALKEFLENRTADELCVMVALDDERRASCSKTRCNCGGPERCENPFWVIRSGEAAAGAGIL